MKLPYEFISNICLWTVIISTMEANRIPQYALLFGFLACLCTATTIANFLFRNNK